MNKTVALLVLACLACVSVGYNLVNMPNDDRVKVDFYFESLCPYCQQYMVGALKTAANTADFWKICDFNLYPYGNARRQQNGSSWSFTCQHGVRECEGNFIETCALKLYDKYTQALPFIICLETNSNDWTAQGKKCAQQLSLDWNAISTCATSSAGVNYLVEMAVATENLVPAHTYVPWVVVNGVHSASSENAVQANMVRYVCSIYKGTEKIAACK
jgi:interferon gamma-inducible protein 30